MEITAERTLKNTVHVLMENWKSVLMENWKSHLENSVASTILRRNILKKYNVAWGKSAPKYYEKQKFVQKDLRHLSEHEICPSNGLEVTLDSEQYFIFDGSDSANNKSYYCRKKQGRR